MRLCEQLCVAACGWTTAVVLTVVGTLRPNLGQTLMLWILLSLAVAVTVTVSLIVSRAEHEVLERMPRERSAHLSAVE